jgi:hypothetical protein
MNDLRDLKTGVANIRSGKANGRGFVLRRFPVNPEMTILTLYPFGNRQAPLGGPPRPLIHPL